MNNIKEHPKYKNYCITKNGKVWSKVSQRFLKPYQVVSGHLSINLSRKNRSKYIHRLVLETYISDCPDGMECRHLDGNPQNNNLSNLCWGTPAENTLDAIKHGTHMCIREGENSSNHQLTKHDVVSIIRLYKTGICFQKKLAKKYNVSQATISDIINKKIWKHI